jgi:hypothetical protein
MPTTHCASLLAALQDLSDPRHRRGVRHPFVSLLALTLLGLICRQTDFAAIARWANRYWADLQREGGHASSGLPPRCRRSLQAATRLGRGREGRE